MLSLLYTNKQAVISGEAYVIAGLKPPMPAIRVRKPQGDWHPFQLIAGERQDKTAPKMGACTRDTTPRTFASPGTSTVSTTPTRSNKSGYGLDMVAAPRRHTRFLGGVAKQSPAFHNPDSGGWFQENATSAFCLPARAM